MDRKLVTGGALVKAAGDGTAVAIFSRFGGPPDHDGDVTVAGAFTHGAVVPVSGWNHASWGPGMLPVGKATILSQPDRAEAHVEFFLDTQAGRDTWATIKNLGGSQWSYGYDVLDSEPGSYAGQRVRMLKRLAVHEVSPVLRGAGRDTATVAIRSDPASRAVFEAARAHLDRHYGRRAIEREFLRSVRR